MLYGQEIECPNQKIGHCQKSVALWTGLLYGQKAVCFMDGIALWTKSGMLYGRDCFMDKKRFALWTGLLYGQKAACFMDNNSNVQARKLDIAKIRLLYGRDCFMDKKRFALWMGLLYGQKVVCFMDGIVLLTKGSDAL